MDTSFESRDRLRAIDNEINSMQESILALIAALRSRRNALAPVSRLPPEVLAAVFSILSLSTWDKETGYLEWTCVVRVCHRWRETALNYPPLWSHINFTKLTPVAMVEILSRAKMAPLHLEANVTRWNVVQFHAVGMQLKTHISHTRHLSISGPLQSALRRLISSAPILESLSLSNRSHPSASLQVIIPVNLLNCTTPSLTSLELESCDISWKSPLLKGLQTLKISKPSRDFRPKLEDWLDALNEIPQLKTHP
jgi:F-box-like